MLPRASLSPRASRSSFFLLAAGVVTTAVVFGFGRTYAAPMLRGSFSGPRFVHLHGAFAMAWITLFVAQPLLVRFGQVAWHRRLGQLGLPLAAGVALTTVLVGVNSVARDVAAGGGDSAVSVLLGSVTSAMVFLVLVTAGIVTRRRREAHARWMLLATLVVAWPAWFRLRHWFPSVPHPEIWFGLVAADVWIVVAMVRDYVVRRSIHPVLLWGGTAIIVEQSLEVWLFDSAAWRVAANYLYAALRGLAVQ